MGSNNLRTIHLVSCDPWVSDESEMVLITYNTFVNVSAAGAGGITIDRLLRTHSILLQAVITNGVERGLLAPVIFRWSMHNFCTS